VLISLPTSIFGYSSLKQRVPGSLGYVLESYVIKSFPCFSYVMHVLNEFLLNEKMSFHKFMFLMLMCIYNNLPKCCMS